MKNICIYLIGSVVLQLFSVISSKAQSANGDLSILKTQAHAVTIDGDAKKWGDSLQYFNAEVNARYAFSNDKDNLYFAIKIDDLSEVARILKAGISIGFDPKGKKKNAYSITFPVSTQLATSIKPVSPDYLNGVTQADRDELHKDLITNLRGIKVEGFKDIEGDMITTSNTYGIKTAVDYDAKGNLVCEAAIPLKFFSLDAHSKIEWLYNVTINGITNPNKNRNDNDIASNLGGRGGGMGGGRGGMGGGRGGKGNTGGATTNTNTSGTLSKTVEFSGKFYLATGQ